jgi:hypothetical protein
MMMFAWGGEVIPVQPSGTFQNSFDGGVPLVRLALDAAECVVEAEMELRGNVFGRVVVHQSDVAGMLRRMAEVNPLPAATFPFGGRSRMILQSFVQHINWGAKNVEVV